MHGLSILWFLVKNEIDVADGSLEKNIPSVGRDQYPIHRQNTLRGLWDGNASIPVRYRMKLSEAVFTQLQLWHFHLLVSVH